MLKQASLAAMSAFVLSVSSYANPPKMAAATQGKGLFIENRGQWDARAQFLSQTTGVNEWVTDDGVVLDFSKFTPDAASSAKQPSGTRQGHVVKIGFANAKPTQVSGVAKQEGQFNYLLGSDESKWVIGARLFSEARAEEPYAGIGVRYYTEKGRPRYDLLVSPGADPSQVGLKVEGANSVRVLDNGDLAIDTSLGTVEEKGLTAYQEKGGARIPIPCHMVQDGNTIRFDAGSYDPSTPLIIDPLVYSTMMGGTNGRDYFGGLAATPSGNAVYYGNTTSTNFPTSTGAYQSTSPTKFQNVTITELNSSGTGIVFSTFLGGSGEQLSGGLAVDSAGDPVVSGSTDSSDFPVTAGAYQKTNLAWPSLTVFVTKLNASGTGLVFSTLLGGIKGQSGAYKTALDAAGNVLVGGFTQASDFPVSAGALQNSLTKYQSEFVTKLNSTGSALIFSTFLGSVGDAISGLAFDKSGYAYVAGYSNTNDVPTTTGAYQTKNNASNGDNGFVLKLNANASALIYGTYLGGSTNDLINSLVVDPLGNAVVGGEAYSTDFPTTAGAFQTSDHAATGANSGFVTKFNGAGTKLAFSTYLGGSEYQQINAVALDSSDNVVVTGFSDSPDYPTTTGAYQTNDSFENNDVIVTQLKGNGTGLLYSSFLGGTSGEYGDDGYGIVVNSLGQVLVSGFASSYDFPVTPGAWQSLVDANGEEFTACFSLSASAGSVLNELMMPPTIVSGLSASCAVYLNGTATAPVTVTFTGSGPGAIPVQAVISAGSSSETFTILTNTVTSPQAISLTAQLGSVSISHNMEVIPMAISYLSVNPSPVIGGTSVTASMTLSAYLGYGMSDTVNIKTTGPASTNSSQSIPYGTNYLDFTVFTSDVDQVTPASITVSMGSYSKTVSFNVYPTFKSAVFAASSVVGGTNATLNVTTYLPEPINPQAIYLEMNNYSPYVTFPYDTYVQQGASQAAFTIQTRPVSANTTVVFTVTSGNETVNVPLTITTPPITGLTFTPSNSVVGGQAVTAKITLGGPAGGNGDTISVQSSSASVVVPASVLVGNGGTTMSFAVTTKTVTTSTPVTITVKLGSSMYSSVLTLTP